MVENKIPLTIHNNEMSYRFLLSIDDDYIGRLYIPDHNPTVYNYNPAVRLITANYDGSNPELYYFDFLESQPCKPFRYEGLNYSSYWVFRTDYKNQNVIFEFCDYDPDSGYTVNPSWSTIQTAYLTPDIDYVLPSPEFLGMIDGKYKIRIPVNLDHLRLYVSTMADYVILGTTVDCKILTDSAIYWQFINPEFTEDGIEMELDMNVDLPIPVDKNNPLDNYGLIPSSKIVYRINVMVETPGFSDGTDFVNDDYKDERLDSILFPFQSKGKVITQEDWAKFVASQDDLRIFDHMEVKDIRIVNKTIQKVVQVESKNDSKNNIVQPIFFKTRDIGSIVVHPEVTENICINLDTYKSVCKNFYIQIAGVSFNEIGRTDAGVVFRIEGSRLPKGATAGNVYVYNQDSILVTEGKYSYS